jgi:hypothetical protein
MADTAAQDMVAFLGVAADERLVGEDLADLPAAERYLELQISTHKHDRLVATGSVMTAATLVGGVLLALYGGWRLLFDSDGGLDAAMTALGLLLVVTHWGWVHVAEYVGLTIDGRQERALAERRRDWLASVEPYPRFSVSTSVLADASTRIERVLHRPVLTERQTFTFVRETDAEKTYDADTSAEVIAAAVEAMRRQARLDTDRRAAQWEAASSAYAGTLFSTHDDQQRLAAQRAAATALSEHINASLLEPPLVE